MKINPIFLDYNYDQDQFVVEFDEYKDDWLTGNVYPISREGYVSRNDGGYTEDKSVRKCMFGFLCIWRGVWDERLYFKDDEYWSFELKTMYELWEMLRPKLREIIRQDRLSRGEYDPYEVEK